MLIAHIKNKTAAGFTIVELLIVIVVIAILASTSVAAYTGIQNRAYDTTVRNDMRQFATQMEIVKIDNNDTYPSGYEFTRNMGFAFSRSAYASDGDYQSYNIRYCRNETTNTYILFSQSKSGRYLLLRDGEVVQASATYGWGVCRHVGQTDTNPTANAYHKNNGWSSWVN